MDPLITFLAVIYEAYYNQAPTAPSTINVPSEVIGGENITVTWGASTDSDGNLSGYILEKKVDSGTWTQIYKGSARTYSVAVTYGSTSIQFRVKAYDAAGAESAYTTSASRTVINNRAPVISGSDGDLGSVSSAAPTHEYVVTDADGHQVDVVESLDGVAIKGEHFSHLTMTKRIQIDAFLRAGMKPTEIAKEIGVHYTTVYREMKRATYEHLNSDLTTEIRYNPDEADRLYREHLKAKGPDLKLGNDYELADYLVEKIRDEKYSPEAAVGEAEVNGWRFKTKVCASTVYNYIRGEVFGDELTTEMLPQGGKRKPARKAPEGTVSRAPAGKSIEQRPKEVDTRETFGHWEMDSVESCQGVSNTLLVLTERKTRNYKN